MPAKPVEQHLNAGGAIHAVRGVEEPWGHCAAPEVLLDPVLLVSHRDADNALGDTSLQASYRCCGQIVIDLVIRRCKPPTDAVGRSLLWALASLKVCNSCA